MGLLLFLLEGCRSPEIPAGPLLERVSRWNSNPTYIEYDEAILHKWMESETPVSIVQTPEDRMPNGLARSMAPFLVDWNDSDIETQGKGYFVVRNVLVEGNPILGIGKHASVRIPVAGVERVELVIVRYNLDGLAKFFGHVQLRFIFKENQRPVALDSEGNPDAEQPYLDDLMLSWEAWRAPLTTFSAIQGMKTKGGYALTARLYADGQRFLNDSLRGAVWDCYPLDLPGGEETASMVLVTGLVMGDAVGRRVMMEMEEQVRARNSNTSTPAWDEEVLRKARGRFDWDEMPDSTLKEVMKKTDLSYNTFKQSCISVTIMQINTALERLYAEKKLKKPIPLKVEPAKIPDWFDHMLEGNKWKIATGAPGALFWIMHNSELLPYKAYLPLKKAGLLKLDKKGQPIIDRYGHKGTSPYGTLHRNLM